MGKGSRSRQSREGEVKAKKEQQGNQSFWARHGNKVIFGALAVAVVVVLTFAVLHTTGAFSRNATALEVGDMKITALEYRVYYALYRSNYLMANYSSLAGYYGTSLGSIDAYPYLYDQNISWADFFTQGAVEAVSQYYSLYQDAVTAGHQMTEQAQKQLDAYMDEMKKSAEQLEIPIDEYIKTYITPHGRLKDVQEIMERRFYAQSYYDVLQESYIEHYTDEDLQAYYQEHRNDYDNVRYRAFSFPYEKVEYTEPTDGKPVEQKAGSVEEAERMTAANKEAAKALADEFLSKITSEQSFSALAREYASEDKKADYADDSATLTGASQLSTSNSEMSTWYKDLERKHGDTAVIESGLSYTVVYFVERYLPEGRTVSVRHILFGIETAAEDASEEDKAEVEANNEKVKEKAQLIYDTWLKEGGTEEAFAKYASENSEDSGSVGKGGLYREFSEHTMVAEFNDWSFDPARKYGDSAIVETSYGYHIMFFVGEGRVAWVVDSENKLASAEMDEYFASMGDKYPVVTHQYNMSMS